MTFITPDTNVINAFLSILDIVYNYTDNQFKLIINRQLT